MMHGSTPNTDGFSDTQEPCKLKTSDKSPSTKSSPITMPESLIKIREQLNLLGFTIAMFLIIFSYHFSTGQSKSLLVWACFSVIVSVILFGFLQTLLPTSPSGANIGNIGVKILQGTGVLLIGVLTRDDELGKIVILPAIGIFSASNPLLLEVTRIIITTGYFIQKNLPGETYAVIIISYLDGIFYLITSAVLWQMNLSKPAPTNSSSGDPHEKSAPTQTFSIAPQTMMASEPSPRENLQPARDIEVSEMMLQIKQRQEVISNCDISERISESPSARPPRETHRLTNPLYREPKSTQIHLFDRPAKANSRKSTYNNKRNPKLVINFNLAANQEGLQHAKSHDPKKDGTALDLPIPPRYTSNRGSSQNEFRFDHDSDRKGTLSPRSVSVFETKYMSLINQIVIACDESMTIIYNNYHERFYPTILKKMASSINIGNFRTTGSTLGNCFVQNTEYLKTDEATIKTINRLSGSLGIDFTDLESDPSVKSNNLLNFFRVIRSQILKSRKRTERFQMKRLKHNLDVSKNMPKSLELLDVSITIHDVLRFLGWFFAASSVESHGFNFPLSLRFYIHTSIQIQFTLVLNHGSYLVYLSFECVEDKLALGETNNKLNYSYLLLCSLSHELLTPLNQLMLISEQLAKNLDKSAVGARRHLEIKAEGGTPSTARNSVINYSGSFAKMLEDSAQINLMARGLTLTVQNFLDFAKYIIRTLKVVPRPLDLSRVIADTVRIVQLKLQKKGLAVKVDVQCDAHMVSDEDKLAGLLYTFLDNAVKYTQQGGISLTVKNGHTADHLRFEVADTGIGIDEEDMFKISSILENPFVDLKTRYSAGIGIGLRVAQVLIMYLSGGDIELNVSSLKGHGTTVSFEILRQAKEFDSHHLLQTQKKSIDNNSKQLQEDFAGKLNQLVKTSNNISQKAVVESPDAYLSDHEGSEKKAPSPMASGINLQPTIPTQEINLAQEKKLLQKNSLGADLLRAKVNKLITTSIVVKAFSKNRQSSLGSSVSSPRKKRAKAASNDSSGIISEGELTELSVMNTNKNLKSVLVVDDEILNTELLQIMLVDLGYEVFTAYDGENAIEQCLTFLTFNKKLDIIFMDYSMPLMNGDICAQRLRSSKFDPILKDVPIVGLTAHRDDEIANKCLAAGMTMIEYKPISMVKIQGILEKYHLIVSDKERTFLKTSSLQIGEPKDATIQRVPSISNQKQQSSQRAARKSSEDSGDGDSECMDEELVPV